MWRIQSLCPQAQLFLAASLHPWRTRARWTTFLVLGGVMLAACGGGAPAGVASLGSTTSSAVASSAGNSGPPPSPALAKAQLAYSECIRNHGIPRFPDPQASGGFPSGSLDDIDQNSPQYLAAEKDCAAQAKAADMAPPTKAQQEAHMAVMLKISACMQHDGFPNFPDLTSEGGFAISPGQLDMDTPQYAAAAKKCDAPPGGAARQKEAG
jgi:hypothetical protein